MSTAIEPSDNLPAGQLSFRNLLSQATAIVDTGQLEKDKARLVGVPHIITRVTYRPGVPQADGTLGDYVSLEAVIADTDTLTEAFKRGWMPEEIRSLDDLLFRPEEKIVYNDGGTGVRRQVTMILHNAGIINVGELVDNASFDKPYYQWESFTQTSEMNGDGDNEKITVPDVTTSVNGQSPLAIVAYHGLRFSIEPKFGKTVFYLS